MLCLASAMALAGLLISDKEDVGRFDAAEGDHLELVGELDAFPVPQHWTEVHNVLSGSTYRLEQSDPNVLLLLTGMDAGWDDKLVVAHVLVILDTPHPDRDARIVVLSAVETPTVPR